MASVGVLKLGNISLEKTALFVCDLQEKFQPAIAHFADIVDVTKRLVNGAKILNIPIIVTEQYPKGLGKTVKEVDVNGVVGVFEKTKFSMVVPAVDEAMKSVCGQLRHVILCGVETHVCVQQTVIDLLERGIDVHVVADGTSSRNQMDRIFALERFRHSGAIVTTSEAVLLQLVQDKDHPKFKDIQAIIKPLAPVSGLVAMY